MDGTLALFSILMAFLAACFVVPRFYCRYACPLGAALGVVAMAAPGAFNAFHSANSALCASRPVPPAQSGGKTLTLRNAYAVTSAM